MNCEQIQPNLLDYSKGLLTGLESKKIKSHLEKCPMCAAILKQEMNFSEKLAMIPDVEPANDVWALVRAQTKPKTIRLMAWFANIANVSVNVRRAAAAVAVSAIVAFTLYSIKPEAPTQTSITKPVHTMTTTVKWADDPLGNHTDAMVESINNM